MSQTLTKLKQRIQEIAMKQEEHQETQRRFLNRQSFNGRLNSNSSIDRYAIKTNSPSLEPHISLFDAMDIEVPDRKSDLYENVLGEGRNSGYKRNSNYSRADLRLSFERDSGADLYKQDDCEFRPSQRRIHECDCSDREDCLRQHCKCFLYSNELCIEGVCCQRCIKYKYEFMSMASKPQSLLMGCLCKNIKCLKMYCSCYRQGKKCSKAICKCEGCENDTDGLIELKKKEKQKSKKVVTIRPNYHMDRKAASALSNLNEEFNCACQKSNCLKNYCSCYSRNQRCNPSCTCRSCDNQAHMGESDDSEEKARVARYARRESDNEMDQQGSCNDIDKYLVEDDNYENCQMNEHMQFEPVDFSNVQS